VRILRDTPPFAETGVGSDEIRVFQTGAVVLTWSRSDYDGPHVSASNPQTIPRGTLGGNGTCPPHRRSFQGVPMAANQYPSSPGHFCAGLQQDRQTFTWTSGDRGVDRVQNGRPSKPHVMHVRSSSERFLAVRTALPGPSPRPEQRGNSARACPLLIFREKTKYLIGSQFKRFHQRLRRRFWASVTDNHHDRVSKDRMQNTAPHRIRYPPLGIAHFAFRASKPEKIASWSRSHTNEVLSGRSLGSLRIPNIARLTLQVTPCVRSLPVSSASAFARARHSYCRERKEAVRQTRLECGAGESLANTRRRGPQPTHGYQAQ